MNHSGVTRQPYGTPGGARYALTAKVDPLDVVRIEAAAAEAGVSRSRWIAEALLRALRSPEVGLVTAPSTSAAGSARVNVEAAQAA